MNSNHEQLKDKWSKVVRPTSVEAEESNAKQASASDETDEGGPEL